MNIRLLKFLIAVMGVLIIVGVATVIGTVVVRLQNPGSDKDFGQVALTVPLGTKIESVTVSDGRLVLHLGNPNGGTVRVLDIATGALLGEVTLDHAE